MTHYNKKNEVLNAILLEHLLPLKNICNETFSLVLLLQLLPFKGFLMARGHSYLDMCHPATKVRQTKMFYSHRGQSFSSPRQMESLCSYFLWPCSIAKGTFLMHPSAWMLCGTSLIIAEEMFFDSAVILLEQLSSLCMQLPAAGLKP